MTEDCKQLIARLDQAMRLGQIDRVTRGVKAALEGASCGEGLRLPDQLTAVRRDCYARRLLHRSTQDGYTVVVMTWGPGQRTQLHDHAGMWCVECVVRGALSVEQYELVEQREARYRFTKQKAVRAEVGEAGCLIPPFEYHVLGNALDDRPSVSLHVYAGEMDHCNLYVPRDGGWWSCSPKRLAYDS